MGALLPWGWARIVEHGEPELVALLREVVGYDGEIRYQSDKPDGTPAKRLDVSRLHALGWTAKIGLREGLERTYRWHLANSPEAAPAG